jgi:squalene-associated FAD-dependent desaturase
MSAAENQALDSGRPLRVAIIGGGLAGLAAAAALADSRLQRESQGAALAIELFESRRMLGGRATSYRDPETGGLIDNCQHVTLGCCTNFDDFCRRTEIDGLFTRETALHFLGPDGRDTCIRRSAWLAAPLHLAPSLLRLGYLTWRERLAVASGLRRLARLHTGDASYRLTIGRWLRMVAQPERAIELFWTPVIVSALSEDIDRASVAASRKVFVDAFLRHRRGYEMSVPKVPLRSLYDDHLIPWLSRRGVNVQLGHEVRAIELTSDEVAAIGFADGSRREVDFVCLAVPWFRVAELFSGCCKDRLEFLENLVHLEPAPITSVHLWMDQRLPVPHRHAVLPGRFSQWIFDRSTDGATPYYQIVISASRQVASMSRDEVIARVCGDLELALGVSVRAVLKIAKVITEQRAVFSPTTEVDQHRPPQRTPVPNLLLAGDWTATGWPATMEGAVRSGYLAAEAMLERLGNKERFLVADLPAAPLARWLLGIR